MTVPIIEINSENNAFSLNDIVLNTAYNKNNFLTYEKCPIIVQSSHCLHHGMRHLLSGCLYPEFNSS